jgi:hypothetical protein
MTALCQLLSARLDEPKKPKKIGDYSGDFASTYG